MFLKKLVVTALVVVAAACNRVPDSEVVARVNGQPILKKDFDEQVERNMARYKGQNHQLPPTIEQRIKESVLRRMIDDEMIAQKAKGLGVDIAQADLDAKFTEYKGRFRTDEAFADYLKRANNTEQNMRDDLKRNLLRDQVVEKLSGAIDVTPDEVAKYYEENKQRFIDREQVKASHILIKFPAPAAGAKPGQGPSDKEKKDAKKKAEVVRAAAAAKGADFAAIAAKESQAPDAQKNGDLGFITRGRLAPEVDNVAFALNAEAVSPVIETKQGFEIVKVFEKKAERTRPVDEVQENIKNSLLARKKNEKRRDILRDLKTSAKIEQLVKFEEAPAGAPAGMPGAPGEGGPQGGMGQFKMKPQGGMPMPPHGAVPPAAEPGKAPAGEPADESPEN